jgi:hypothetical protein
VVKLKIKTQIPNRTIIISKQAIKRMVKILTRLEINLKKKPHLKKQRKMLLNFKHCSTPCPRTCMSAKRDFLKVIVK